ncbi:STAS domain-containing protein [Dactylosporangium sp. NPDC049742]|uniref:STAS domain-containing protein n=1 Tax=Dactylosporangium sp. NPDC049742 TaxID=3154737 RepID=UPI0034149590
MESDRARAIVTPVVTPEALILRIVGDVDADTSWAVHTDCWAAVVSMPPPSLVIVDLLAVEFLSAAAVRLLLQFADACGAKGLRLCLIVASGTLQLRILMLAGLDQRVAIFPTVNDAFAADGA